MPNFNQNAIIDKLNEYLKSKDRKIELKHGYCHGISLLWLYKMSTGHEAWFYEAIKKIQSCENKNDFDNYEFTFEKFLSHIEWLQNSEKYLQGTHQLQVDKLFEIPKKLSIPYVFTHEQLSKVLADLIPKHTMICVSGPSHTIGVYKRNNTYYVYDPNYDEGCAKPFNDVKKLKLEILKCIFHGRQLYEDKIPLEFNLANISNDAAIDTDKIMDELIAMSSELDEPDYDGVTNLYLACENDDADEVLRLLLKKANPNQVCHHDWTPLQLAAHEGYTKIVDLLLQYGADPNLLDKNGDAPLHFAARTGNEDIVKLLLAKGADVTKENKKGDTAISDAAKNKHLNLVGIMLQLMEKEKKGHVAHKEERKVRRRKHYHQVGLFAHPKEVRRKQEPTVATILTKMM